MCLGAANGEGCIRWFEWSGIKASNVGSSRIRGRHEISTENLAMDHAIM